MGDRILYHNHFLPLFIADITRDPANAFMDFPEMRKLWLLMDDLPELYQTYYYTMIISPNKVWDK